MKIDRPPARWRSIDLGLGGLLFAAALLVRISVASQIVFPPLDDPAFYLQTARHVAEGRGLVSDVLWNYFVAFPSVTHPSHEFWMPLATLFMAAAIKLFGDTLLAAQLPGMVCGALLPVLTYALGRYLWPVQRRWSVLAALLVVPGAIPVYQSGSADSAALYALLSAGALALAAVVIDRARQGGQPRPINLVSIAFGVGLLCGLSYLTRSHGSLLLAAIAPVWLIALRRDLGRALILIGALAVGAVLIVGPWWWRNLQVFGAPQPFPLTLALAATDYGTWFNSVDRPSLERLWAGGLAAALQLRWAALGHDLSVMGLITFPFGVIGLPVVLTRRDWLFRLWAVYAVLAWIVVSGVFPVPALTGSFYHSAGTLVPGAALGGVAVIRALAARPRWRSWSVGVSAGLILLVLGQSILAWPAIIADSRANQAKFAAATAWLRSNVPPDQPVITNEAHSLNYASGYPALTLPNQENVAEVAQLADRYGAHFVVMVGSAGRYPAALDRSDRAIERLAEGDVSIYEFKPD
jgi:hypothetical protein